MENPIFSFLVSLLLSAALPLHASAARLRHSKAQDGVVTVELWCVAKNNAQDAALQGALNWACGPGGSNCSPIQPGGPCYDPNDLQRTASFAFNDYYLNHGLTDDSCNFDNTAALTSLNPSYANCKFPSSFTVNNGSSTGASIIVGMAPGSADLSGNGCGRIADRGGWALITIHLFFAITLSIQGL